LSAFSLVGGNSPLWVWGGLAVRYGVIPSDILGIMATVQVPWDLLLSEIRKASSPSDREEEVW